jgi:heptosyltransferase-2
VPLRVGPASKVFSILFNRRVWQHRSKGQRHEADYNLELLAPLGIPFERTPTEVCLSDEERDWAQPFLKRHGIEPGNPFVCLHPGSGGSSPRWPWENFLELGTRLRKAGAAVAWTSGPGEERPRTDFPDLHGLTVRQLAAVYGAARLVVSNSTGPLHLAVAMGTPTVSIYAPDAACHPRRWGPYPAYATKDPRHAVLMPADAQARDLKSISVDEALRACERLLFDSPKSAGRLSR